MKTTRFFRNLRRINSILIFLVSLLAVGVLGYIAIEFMDFGQHDSEQVVQIDVEPAERAEPPTLDSFYSVSGTSIMRAGLTFGDRYSRGSFSKGGSYSTRNYLFLDPETLQAHWLFPDNKQLIIDSDGLQEIVQEDESKKPTYRAIAHVYQTIDKDTNGDKQLTPEDKMSLAYSRPDGREYTSVIGGITRILGTDTVDRGTKHVVAYEADGKWITAVVSLRTFEIEKKGKLPTR